MGFNGLTDAQAERLALLMEELGEAQQAIGKILRHGYESYNPTQVGGPSNRQALQHELGDVLAVMDMMCAARDIEGEYVVVNKNMKLKRLREGTYLHHQ
jgi:NTP pyrophosphatase (non-canonical NTP hydrolase)